MRKISILLAFLLLIVSISAAFAQIDPDAADQEKIRQIVSEMTLRQKIAQMVIPAMRTWSEGDNTENITELNDDLRSLLKEYPFGGIVLFGANIVDAGQTALLVHDMQKTNLEGEAPAMLFIATDQEGGYITRLKTGTQMPGSMALGATGNPGLAKISAAVMGKELSMQGVNMDFAPVTDVNNDPSNPVIGIRSFSDDPSAIGSYAISFIEGLHEAGVISCLKHFPGHGDTDVDSHTGLPLINKTFDELMETELVPYTEALPFADMVMTAHIQFPLIETETYQSLTGEQVYLPATLSKKIITDILRSKLGFNRVVATDALEMDAIKKYFGSLAAAEMAINAGVDLLLVPIDITSVEQIRAAKDYINGIAEMVEAGTIAIDRIDEAVTRILLLKSKYGLLTDEIPDLDDAEIQAIKDAVGSKINHEIEWNIAKQSITLLKNADGLLPLSGEESILFAVSDNSQVKSVTYTVGKLMKEGIVPENFEFQTIVYPDVSAEELSTALGGKDAVIVVTNLSEEKELNPLTENGENAAIVDSILSTVHKNGAKFVQISAHLPYDAARYPAADAVLVCYNARGMTVIPDDTDTEISQYGPNIPAAIYTIFGGNDPVGKLPVNVMEIGMDYTYTNNVAYERGFCLSY